MAGDVTQDSLVPDAGSIVLRDLTLDPGLLDRWQAPAGRQQWWRERVARCHGLVRRDGRRDIPAGSSPE
jgi:O-succinylbenzoate synthase